MKKKPKKKRHRKVSLIDRIKTALAVQGSIFIGIKMLTYIAELGIVKRYAIKLMWKGYLSQWF